MFRAAQTIFRALPVVFHSRRAVFHTSRIVFVLTVVDFELFDFDLNGLRAAFKTVFFVFEAGFDSYYSARGDCFMG
jgi:hypothetical protein